MWYASGALSSQALEGEGCRMQNHAQSWWSFFTPPARRRSRLQSLRRACRSPGSRQSLAACRRGAPPGRLLRSPPMARASRSLASPRLRWATSRRSFRCCRACRHQLSPQLRLATGAVFAGKERFRRLGAHDSFPGVMPVRIDVLTRCRSSHAALSPDE